MLLHVTDVLPRGSFECDPIYYKRGRFVHEACDLMDTVGLDMDTLADEFDGIPWTRPFVRGYQQFLQDTGAVVVASEKRVENLKYGYKGRLDRVYKIGRKYYIPDLKSGSYFWTVGMQTAAYEKALPDELKRLKPIRAVLVLTDSGKYNWKAEDTPQQKIFESSDFQYFLAYLQTKQCEIKHGVWTPPERKEE